MKYKALRLEFPELTTIGTALGTGTLFAYHGGPTEFVEPPRATR